MKKVVVVLPAYNAEKTLRRTYNCIPKIYRNNVLLVDDKSTDHTVRFAKSLGIDVIVHKKNLGYGGNQKTCFTEALNRGADIVVMVHPDYQYPPQLIEPMVAMLESELFDFILGSRILSGGALKGGMPLYKYIFNRFLTATENIFTGAKISEYHTGLRAYTRKVLENVDFHENSDDFIFDNQIILQALAGQYRVGEISSPCVYFDEASSINFRRSMTYGIGCLYWGALFFLGRLGFYRHPLLYRQYR